MTSCLTELFVFEYEFRGHLAMSIMQFMCLIIVHFWVYLIRVLTFRSQILGQSKCLVTKGCCSSLESFYRGGQNTLLTRLIKLSIRFVFSTPLPRSRQVTNSLLNEAGSVAVQIFRHSINYKISQTYLFNSVYLFQNALFLNKKYYKILELKAMGIYVLFLFFFVQTIPAELVRIQEYAAEPRLMLF